MAVVVEFVLAVVVAEAEGHHHTYNCTVFAAVALYIFTLLRIFDFPQLCSQT